jgi:hypothetical protein
VAANKQSFFESINKDTVFDESFFKKVYGYSVCDDLFLGVVASKLISIGRSEIVQAYNNWYAAWKTEDDRQMKKVAEWYHKECDKEFERWQKEQQEKAVSEWQQKTIALLTLKKKLLQSIES